MDSKYNLTSKSPLKSNNTSPRIPTTPTTTGRHINGFVTLKRKNENSNITYNENSNNKINKFNINALNNSYNNNKRNITNSFNARLSTTSTKTPIDTPPQSPTVSSAATKTNGLSIDDQRQLLPVYHCRERLIQEMRKSDTLIIMGETGSGKTTQIPQFLMSAGYTKKGIIGITQPRRVAAITVAKRVAQEHGSRLGDAIGYTVRFEDCTSSNTHIKFMTDGSLLREALSDRFLRQYSVLMLDEAHERTINTDILFGIVKEAQKQRRIRNMTPLKLIITSATMDIDHFANYFNVCGMYLEGRAHHVKVLHTKEPQSDYLNAALVTLFEVHRNMPIDHDVLIFLTGQEEIESMALQIRQIAKVNNIDLPAIRVYTLYAQMPQQKQLECFLPASQNVRKIVLATNIAETSITIPGIRVVIDCGFVKRRIYSPNSGLEVLRVVRISQAQSWQRCGRAGRDAPGICYRTYTQNEMSSLERMPKPEILRSNICTVVLQLMALNIDCQTFDFLDRPTPEAVNSAYKKLETLGAIKCTTSPIAIKRSLTQLGDKMSQFPLHPQYSKLLLMAPQYDCMEEMLSIVALLSTENVFVTSAEKREQAALAHAKFTSKYGDHLTLLNVYNAFREREHFKLWCHDNFLNSRNLLYAHDVRQQLLEIVERLELPVKSCEDNLDQVRMCLISGLYDNIAELQRDNFYLTIAGRQRAKIHPSSVFHAHYRPEYIIYTEIVLTERNYLRQVTEISSEWIAEVVPNYAHLSRIRNPLKTN